MPRFFADLLCSLIREDGIDVVSLAGEPFLEAAGGDACGISVAAAPYIALLENASALRGDPAYGLLLAQRVLDSNLNVFGAIGVVSGSLREAIAHMTELQIAFLGSELWNFRESGGLASLTPTYVTQRVMTDLSLAVAFQYVERALRTGDRSELCVCIALEPSNTAPYRAIFRDRIQFGLPTRVSFPSRLLDRARPGSDPALADTLRAHVVSRIALTR